MLCVEYAKKEVVLVFVICTHSVTEKQENIFLTLAKKKSFSEFEKEFFQVEQIVSTDMS